MDFISSISFPNEDHFWVGATAKQHQTHPKPKVMTKKVKKCSTGQSCIPKEVTSYKIHTLAVATIFKSLSFPSTATL